MDVSTAQAEAIGRLAAKHGIFEVSSTKIKTKTGNYTHKNFFAKFKVIKEFSAYPELGELVLQCEDTEELQSLFLAVVSQIRDEKSQQSLGINGESYRESLEEYANTLIPILSYETGELCFFDPEFRKISTIESTVVLRLRRSNEADIMAVAEPAVLEFNPYSLEPFYRKETRDGVEVFHFNTYKCPPWRAVPSTPEIPPLVKKLLDHLFVTAESKEFAMHWLYHLIMDRNQTHLCLNGSRGVGKGVFASLCRGLVGMEYSEILGESALIEKFNSPLKDKRLCVFDEIEVKSTEAINRLKAFANKFVAFEAKGQDAKTIQNYNSFIISMNEIDGLQIGPQERRFSILDITKVPLLDTMTEEEVQVLVSEFEDNPHSEMVAAFGHWIMENGKTPNYRFDQAFKGKHFYEVVYAGMREWQQFLVDHITARIKPEYTMSELRSAYEKYLGISSGGGPNKKGGQMALNFPQNPSTIRKFLYDYSHEGRYKLGDMERIYDEKKYRFTNVLKVAERYLPVEEVEVRAEDIL